MEEPDVVDTTEFDKPVLGTSETYVKVKYWDHASNYRKNENMKTSILQSKFLMLCASNS